jgi:NAD(P)-dependent dehydrogenase (short-subunit alcohol dehydrogenase family)
MSDNEVGMSHTPTVNPQEQQPRPPFPEQRTGVEAEMSPQPDFGEQTYIGYGRLRGRSAIVTGGDSGIGRAVALAFAREGADVATVYDEHDADAEKTERLVENEGRRFLRLKGDIGDEAFCKQVVDRTVRQFGHFDILVNNAGTQQTHQSLLDFTAEEIELTFRTNIWSMFWLTRAAIPHLKPGSTIIKSASIEAYEPTSILLPHATTKGAIVTLTKGLSEEMIERGVRVNAVAPGPVWTPLIPVSMPRQQVPKFGESNPMRRPAQPVELAHAYVFLASNESSYVNGSHMSGVRQTRTCIALVILWQRGGFAHYCSACDARAHDLRRTACSEQRGGRSTCSVGRRGRGVRRAAAASCGRRACWA